jgi:2-polyprenyl-3-methyl-5-hydroxy-6-metoxy-1,4-benzoquinol methylase
VSDLAGSEDLLAELRRRAAERRDRGVYPVDVVRRFHGLADDLARRASPLPSPDPQWRLQLDVLRGLGAGIDTRIDAGIDVVGVGVGEPPAAQSRRYRDQAEDLIEELGSRVDRLEQEVFRAHRLVARVERLEREEERRGFSPWFTNETFAAHFRGSRDTILDIYRDVAALFTGCSPVVDLGSGRGEFVELLVQSGVTAYGVENDGELVAHCAALGLDVRQGDALGHLRSCADHQLGGVAMLQVIEHLTAQEQVDIVRFCAAKVRPGGRVVVESVNPQSLYVYTHALYVDPTHTQPVHPLYLEFLFQQAGFGDVQVHFRSPVPPEDAIDFAAVGPVGDPTRVALERIAYSMFAPQDYVVVATR